MLYEFAGVEVEVRETEIPKDIKDPMGVFVEYDDGIALEWLDAEEFEGDEVRVCDHCDEAWDIDEWFHSFDYVEATEKVKETLELIKAKGCKCGAVISPDTPVERLREFLPLCDLALVMSVYPGFGGQKFITGALNKLCELKRLRDEINPDCIIEVDGGINLETIPIAAKYGSDICVAGTSVFKSTNTGKAIEDLKKASILGKFSFIDS